MTAKLVIAFLLALLDRALGYFQAKKTQETADAQRENDNVDRGGAAGVRERLRSKLAKPDR